METCKKNVLFIYLGVLMFLSFQVSSATDTISTNQPLSGLETIVSSDRIFEFGLTTTRPGEFRNFYIGMWYKQVSPRPIVWVANRESPAQGDVSDCFLKISDGNLVLYNNFTDETIWSTSVNSSRSKDVQAVLLDNGNLVLRDGPNSSAPVLWQSFDHPSDTWLPGAKFKLGNQQLLTSWKSSTDPSPGQYSLEVDPNTTHSLITVWNGSKSYWSSGPWDHQLKTFEGFPKLQGINLSFKLNLDESYITYSVDNYSTYRLVMDVSGLFMLKMLYEDYNSWMLTWYQHKNRCEVYNYCGSFGICNEKEEVQPCSCVPGFRRPLSDDPNDFHDGCIKEFNLQCGNENDQFLPIKNMKIATDDPTTLIFKASRVSACASACLANCSCQAYAYDGNKCLMWTSDAFDLQQLDENKGHTFFVRLAASDISPAPSNILPADSDNGKGKLTKGRSIVLPVVLSSLIAAAAFFRWFVLLYFSKKEKKKKNER